MPPQPLDMTPAATTAAKSTPPTVLTLQQLLDTKQAIPILPGLLYFASTGECLSSSLAGSAEAAITVASVTSVAMEAIHDFYFKENPFASGTATDHGKVASTSAVPTARATVGQDAVFVSLRGTPPYLYRPFFADYGPLDMGCCVHFARRLCELLRAVTGVDVCASPASTSAAAGTVGNDTSSRATTHTHRKRGGRRRPASALSHSSSSISAASTALSGGPPGTMRPVVVCASLDAQERVNTACLVGAFCVLCLGWSAAATWYRGFVDIYPGFLSYRDASQGVSNYPLTLIDVWAGLEQGVALGFANVHTFDLPAYVEGKQHDYSWVVPRRFLAMSSPQDDKPERTAEVFARRLRQLGVQLVVRLNDSLYNPSPLLRLGIRHVDLPYADGSVPSDAVLLRFLQAVEEHFGESVAPASLRQWWSVPSSSTATAMPKTSARAASASKRAHSACASHSRPVLQSCSPMHSGTCRGMPETWTAAPPSAPTSPAQRPDSAHANGTRGYDTCTLTSGEKGAVAVHCLAGLGRTGTMLAVYMMRHYGFTARAVIGWLRLCRPGSISGVQQQYLDAMERRLRPPPHILVAMQLNSALKPCGAAGGGKRFEQQSRSIRSSFSPTLSSMSILLNPAAAALTAGGGDRANAMGRDLLNASPRSSLDEATTGRVRSLAAVTAFQTHGGVVADARPATGTSIVNGHIKRNDTGQTSAMATRATSEAGSDLGTFAHFTAWRNLSSDNAVNLTGLRGVQQQRHQLLLRRLSNNSSSTLSLSTIQPEGAVLDVVARMPVLGGDSPQNRSAATAPPKRGGAVVANDQSPTIRPTPRVGDYKYASTYFVAMEQAGGLPRVYPWPPSSAATSTARGGPQPTLGGSLRPATASLSCELAPKGAYHLGGGSSVGASNSLKETCTAPVSADSCLYPRRALIGALQRQRPYTATAAVSTVPRPRAKRWQESYRRGGAVDNNGTGTHPPDDAPLSTDLYDTKLQSPRPHQAATRARGEWSDKGTHRTDLANTSTGDTGAASRYGGVKLQILQPPSVPMRSSLPWRDGGVTGQADGPRSPLTQSPSAPVIPAASLPLWGRPMLRT
ncbi:tyrosine phosphatase, putative [Leishmania panamensis]|uniref:Tyrosine phosphatase, putative n=1 Tax=Leishmania panamensis TaxID=5679 RepID=A0A088RL88_LEIPA|nr:tyrosine phosphatase, putative [Leishmania panamensis]AIN95959.1 tyrosine phosphatase, putative [Leishmania panamensis]